MVTLRLAEIAQQMKKLTVWFSVQKQIFVTLTQQNTTSAGICCLWTSEQFKVDRYQKFNSATLNVKVLDQILINNQIVFLKKPFMKKPFRKVVC